VRSVDRLTDQRTDILRRFSTWSANAGETSRDLTNSIDEYIVSHLGDLHTEADRWSVIGVGSYGRRDLSFNSDVDCILLYEGDEPVDAVARLEQSVHELWNVGLRASVAAYSLNGAIDLAEDDNRVFSSLIDGRMLIGDDELLDELDSVMSVVPWRRAQDFAVFLREEGSSREGDSHLDLFAAEPDIKLCSGGLRDLASIGWLLRLAGRCGKRAGRTRKERLDSAIEDVLSREEMRLSSREQLLTTRHLLGGVLGLRNERLSRHAMQSAVEQDWLKASSARFQQTLCHARVETACLRSRLLHSFDDDKTGRYLVPGDATAESVDPARLVSTVSRAIERGLLPGTELACAARSVSSLWKAETSMEDTVGIAFQDLLSSKGVGASLSWLHEHGLLHLLVPTMKTIAGLVPGDDVHSFTVDRHSVLVASSLSDMLDRRACLETISSVALDIGDSNRVPLMLSALFHDLGKSGHTPHEINGARRAMPAALRLGLTKPEARLVGFLCEKHMVLSEASVSMDCDDIDVQARIAKEVGTLERLYLLFILTLADIRSLRRDQDTGFREELLIRAMSSIRDSMLGEGERIELRKSIESKRESIKAVFVSHPSGAWIEEFIAGLPGRFLSAFDEPTIRSHVEMLCVAMTSGPRTVIESSRDGNGHDLIYAGTDEPGLLSRISGCLTLEGLSIREARIFSLPNRLVLDIFRVDDGGGGSLNSARRRSIVSDTVLSEYSREEVASRVRNRVKSTLRTMGNSDHGEIVAEVDNSGSRQGTVFHVTGPDAPGLLHMVADILFSVDIDVTGAIVTTEAGIVRDTFFATGRGHGRKVTDADTIRRALRAISGLSH